MSSGAVIHELPKRISELRILFLGQAGVGLQAILERMFCNPPAHIDPLWEPGARCYQRIGEQVAILDASTLYPMPEDHHDQAFARYQLRYLLYDAYILVYDVTDRSSFEALEQIREMVFQGWSIQQEKHPITTQTCLGPALGVWCIMSNKIDRPQNDWAVSKDEGDALARKLRAHFFRTSAITGEGAGMGTRSIIASHVVSRKLLVEAGHIANDPEEYAGEGTDMDADRVDDNHPSQTARQHPWIAQPAPTLPELYFQEICESEQGLEGIVFRDLALIDQHRK